MKKLNITQEEFRSVAGKMVACRAADSLGINITQFYYLSQKFSVRTAFVKKRWSDEQVGRFAEMVRNGRTKREISAALMKTESAVKRKFVRMKMAGMVSND